MSNNKKRWTKEETSLFNQIFHLYNYEELAEIFNCDKIKISAKAVTEGLAPKRTQNNIPEGMKRCSSCKEIFELDFFDGNRSNKDGKSSVCKSCSSLNKSLRYHNKKYKKDIEEQEAKKQAYINKLKGQVLVCKHHGEQTLDDYRIYKSHNGNYSRKCKKCEDVAIKKARDRRLKEQGYV